MPKTRSQLKAFTVRWSSPWGGREYFRQVRTFSAVERFVQQKCKQYGTQPLVFYIYENRKPVGKSDYVARWNC